MMKKSIVKIGERSFHVIRVTNESLTTKETQDSIKNGNNMIDIVLRDGKGSLLFCHEVKDAIFRDIDKEELEQITNNLEERHDESREVQSDMHK